ncbi:hypothetical protein HUJ05_004604 [Dendroctonus ponderosae]|nr:hypothetical protein HUJ05_004604 [Dendroctonus ponderosae]
MLIGPPPDVKDQVNIPIFEEQGDIRQIFLKISSCLPVTITRHDQLPKRICDACSNKLDLLYEFWNSSASAEKTLLSWLGQAGVEDAGEKISAVAQQIAKPAETLVKEESEALDESNLINESRDSFDDQSLDEGTKDEAEAPPPKRARRTAAVKAQINITPESDEDEDDDFDAGEAMTKMEDESEESESELKDDPSYSELPGTSADDDQAGPSGVGKDGVEAPANIDHPNLKEHSCFHTIRQFSTRKKRLKSRRRKDSVSQSKQECKEPHAFKAETDVCIFCSQEVPLNILEKHENAHREEEKRRAKQQKMHYPKEGTTICTICGTLVVCKDLKKHERTHRRLSTVICTICGFSAKNIYQHMGTHSEERRFACQECGMAFKYKKNLDVHIEEEPNFSAGKTTTNKEHLCTECELVLNEELGQHL